MTTCGKCHAANPEDYRFCHICGVKIAIASTPTNDKPSSQPSMRTASVMKQSPEQPLQTDTSSAIPTRKDFQATFTPQQKLYFQQEYDSQMRNPSTALVLTLLLGGLGAHRFYLREWGWGIGYILFSWTFIPVVVALFECFAIRKRTERYNERCASDIRTKMNLIFSENRMASAASGF